MLDEVSTAKLVAFWLDRKLYQILQAISSRKILSTYYVGFILLSHECFLFVQRVMAGFSIRWAEYIYSILYYVVLISNDTVGLRAISYGN